jgi:hypothetical protein
MAVAFGADHTYDADLDVSLRSPAQIAVNLSLDRGGSSDDYVDTVFSDAATLPISSGTAPFTGFFLPEQPLATFTGEDVAGTWTLVVDDDSTADAGAVTRFDLAFCVSAGGASCGDGAVGGGEQCDGADLGGQTCVGLGFAGGALGCTAGCTFDTSACTRGGLFFSEYIEGSSFNKALEIFNGTGEPVDLSQVELRTYSNGQSTFTSLTLGGRSPPEAPTSSATARRPSSALRPQHDLRGQLNGNDAVELVYQGVTTTCSARSASTRDCLGVRGAHPPR